ncbi:MAG TPA: pyrroline-5-carboxylate reductase [Stellaceae bacterium]|nr:pyrroline-5-carboxylate reductase [Stellaceae bacterium]
MSAGAAIAGEVLLVGCGKMGGALLEGWLERGSAERFTVVEPAGPAPAFAGRSGIEWVADAAALAGRRPPAVIVFAVKPQVMGDVVPHYAGLLGPETVALSIAAGKTLGYFARHLGGEAKLVRAMPNTPAAIGRGITVACANRRAGAAEIARCDALLSAVGEVAWVEDEGLIDAVTAVSGSGPAYVFLLIECLAAAGAAAGLPEELATRLARATVAGAGELARRSGESAATLRRNVTSPGGTTQAALDVLMAPDGLASLLRAAVAAAARRSRELAD